MKVSVLMITYNHEAYIREAIEGVLMQLVFFILWTAFIHSKFAPGLHKKWILNDVSPVLVSTIVVLFIYHIFIPSFEAYSRFTLLGVLLLLGIVLISINSIVSVETRKLLYNLIKRRTE